MFIFEIHKNISKYPKYLKYFVSSLLQYLLQVIEMASSKYKGFLGKKRTSELDMVVSSLRKENVYLKKTLVEMSRQHSEHNRLIEVNLDTTVGTDVGLVYSS